MTTMSTSRDVRLADARTVVTPAATMRTYASPSGPATASVAVWRTEMAAGATGPLHSVSEDQVLVVVQGTLSGTLGEQQVDLGTTDAVVLPAGVDRQVTAGPDGAVALVASTPGATARVGDGDPVPVPWPAERHRLPQHRTAGPPTRHPA
ncbi:cupin domain-containing protein, partial [Pedococcus sp. NPDC057267]|uniref:cupin domain-containing protein n=1 Tax=Pedococcus sp. NPDC057267 TaxID=3346077 RepID=UPI00362DCD8B